MPGPVFHPLVLLLSSSRETITTVASQLDYELFNLLITTREEEAVEAIRRGWSDVLVFEPPYPQQHSGCLSTFLQEQGEALPVILITSSQNSFPECPWLRVYEVLHKPINRLELSARLKSVVTLRQLEKQLADQPLAPSRATRVLLVEDSPLQRKILAGYLAGEGIEVITAADGAEALRIAEQQRPDMILLDVVLPGMDGFEVCRHLKENPGLKDTPVVFITSRQGREDKIRGLECGADDFLFKPVDKRELLIRTRSLLRRKQLMDTLVHQASRDPLTGLYNRRQLALDLQRELSRARRYSISLALIMADVDFFKNYNDTNGHLAGDEVLRQLAALLVSNTRDADTVYRYGGEEFIILLPQTEPAGAVTVAEKLRRKVEKHSFPHGEKQPGGRLTISLGVAVYPDHARDAEGLILAADRALYRAKKEGRNRYATATPPG
ncbi:diguanylate cyclase [Desulfofundulus thermosubterraneus]|uniref:Stage 0 sporulation protein A homolog n=1 Tax=Desulfofundulus thermosubterraneus DSM 16057 TaxID=1121432 RepID=A0A1M6HLG3_9FIRM|nr:diguanylate cyclase [Desulfofundulus thermosubterraneus]SHJ22995.1 diguanylate cyclase (GGDEF) domain-containing protein [Desulfofundulus thermosubterraneus DSM 16057]